VKFIHVLSAFCLITFLASPASASRRWGLIEPSGHWLIEPIYWTLHKAGQGFYIATTANNTKVLFDPNGKEVLLPLPADCQVRQIYVDNSSSITSTPEIFRVVNVERKSGVIDSAGQFVIPLDEWSVEGYADGYFLVSKTFADKKSDPLAVGPEYFNFEQRLIVFDRQGTMISSWPRTTKFAYQTDKFHDGILIAQQNFNQRRFVYFDTKGNQLNIPPQPGPVEFREGFLCVTVPAACDPQIRRMYFSSKDGKKLANREFNFCESFVGGFAVVGLNSTSGMKFGVIDRKGVLRIPLIYNQIHHMAPFDFFAETENHRWLALNPAGKVIRHFPLLVEPIGTIGGAIDCTIHKQSGFTSWEDKRALMDSKGHLFFMDDAQSHLEIPTVCRVNLPDDSMLFGLRNKSGWLLKPVFDFLLTAHGGNFIAALQSQTFDPIVWKSESKSSMSCDRTGLFHSFLKENDLIGMPESKLVSLLEPDSAQPNGYRYHYMYGGGCGNSSEDLFIECENNRVKRWCICGGLEFGPIQFNNSTNTWYSTDVVYGGRKIGFVAR
jgi:hypothetical protein